LDPLIVSYISRVRGRFAASPNAETPVLQQYTHHGGSTSPLEDLHKITAIMGAPWVPQRSLAMLTISRIEKAKAPPDGRMVLWDNDPSGSGLPGFGCRVFPSGQRSFIVQYRLPGSRQKQTATIGTYGPITLPQARKKAQEILAKVRLGSDPQAERKARAEAEG
jgi:hypothetical protein